MSSPGTQDLSPASRVYRSPELFGRIGVYLDGPSLAKVIVLEKAHFAERASWLWRRATKRAILHIKANLPSGTSAQQVVAYLKRRAIYLACVVHIDWHANGTHIVRGEYPTHDLQRRCQVCGTYDYIDEKDGQEGMQELQQECPNLRSMRYFGGLEDRTWEVRQVDQAETSGPGEANSIETEVMLDAHLGPANGEWEHDHSDFDDIVNNPAFRWKLTADHDCYTMMRAIHSSISAVLYL